MIAANLLPNNEAADTVLALTWTCIVEPQSIYIRRSPRLRTAQTGVTTVVSSDAMECDDCGQLNSLVLLDFSSLHVVQL